VKRQRRRHRIAQLATFVLLVGTAVGFFLWLMTLGGGLTTLGGTHYSVSAVLPDGGAQLVPGARVTMAGVQVGEVNGVSRMGSDAVVKMTLTNSAVVPLHTGSSAQLRTRTPLGEDYIEIFAGPGHATMPPGAVIPARQARLTVDVDQVLSVLQGPARTEARRLIQGLGGAVNGRGAQLNSLVGSAALTLQNGSQVVNAIAPQRQQISRLVQQLGDLTAGIGQQGTQIRQLALGGLTTFRAIASRDAALSKLIDVLPPTLTAVQTTTNKLHAVTGTVAPVLFNLAATINDARPAAQLLGPATGDLHTVLNDLGAAAPPLKSTLAQLEALSPSAVQALPNLHKVLCQINPILRYAQPYTSDVVATPTELGSASNTFDSIGHTILLDPTINENSFVAQTPAMAQALQTLLHSGFLSTTNHLTYSPYPPPGQANQAPTSGVQVTGPSTLRAQTGYVYPHITADC
jgi:phospholipid/cholesterol/gamma-HCH transport system substrate-binding protein